MSDHRKYQDRLQKNGGTMKKALARVAGNVRHQLPGAHFLMGDEGRLRAAIERSQMESTEPGVGKILRFVLEHTEEDGGYVDFMAYIHDGHVWLRCMDAAGQYASFLRFTAKDCGEANVIPTPCHVPFGWVKSFEQPDGDDTLPDCGVSQCAGVHWDIDRMIEFAQWIDSALLKHRAIHEETLRRAAAVLTSDELVQKLSIKKDAPKPAAAPDPQGNGRKGERREPVRVHKPFIVMQGSGKVAELLKKIGGRGAFCFNFGNDNLELLGTVRDGVVILQLARASGWYGAFDDLQGVQTTHAEFFSTNGDTPEGASKPSQLAHALARVLHERDPRRKGRATEAERPDATVVADQQEAGRAMTAAESAEPSAAEPKTPEDVREDQLASGALVNETKPPQAEPSNPSAIPPTDELPSGDGSAEEDAHLAAA